MTVKAAAPIKITKLEKDFKDSRTGKQYEFVFMRDDEDSNPASYGTFADEEIVRQQYWYNQINENDIIFDIGAAFGSYALPALAMGAIVYAFSPEHEFPLIKKSVAANPGFKERFHVYDFGLYSEPGVFKTDSREFIKKGGMRQEEMDRVNENHDYGWYIHVKKLDDFVNTLDIDKINFIKIDAEGAELEILKGGEQTIRKHKPKLLIEFHLFKDPEMDKKCTEFVKNMGYESTGFVAYTPFVHHGFYVFNVNDDSHNHRS